MADLDDINAPAPRHALTIAQEGSERWKRELAGQLSRLPADVLAQEYAEVLAALPAALLAEALPEDPQQIVALRDAVKRAALADNHAALNTVYRALAGRDL